MNRRENCVQQFEIQREGKRNLNKRKQIQIKRNVTIPVIPRRLTEIIRSIRYENKRKNICLLVESANKSM